MVVGSQREDACRNPFRSSPGQDPRGPRAFDRLHVTYWRAYSALIAFAAPTPVLSPSMRHSNHDASQTGFHSRPAEAEAF
jgi:hypothetical protein